MGTPLENQLEKLYHFFSVENYEINSSNTDKKSALMDDILEFANDRKLYFHLVHDLLSNYASRLEAGILEGKALDELTKQLTHLKLILSAYIILDKLDVDTLTLTKELEKANISFFTEWIEWHTYKLYSLQRVILDDSTLNSKTNKFRLNKFAMREIMEHHLEAMEESRALYKVGIDIIDFDLCSRAFSELLGALYDDTTNDYIDTFLYDHDCCRESILEITWEDGGFTVSDSDSLVDYLDKYVYSEVL